VEPFLGGLLKRYRELILVAVLLVVPLGVFLAQTRHPSERTRLDRGILYVVAPIERATGWVIVKALEGWHGYVALRHAHERAAGLRQTVTMLELDRLELQKVREENERLRRLLGFAQESPDRRFVGARIIGVRLDPKALQLVTIDRGANEGLEPMMPVVVAHGVVGRVHSVAATSADVLLLSDRNSSIAVRVERSRARANVRGTGSPDTCRLEYALRSDDMVEGDVLVTSGTDGVFPRGLPVGSLVGLKRSGQGLYQRSDVRPAVDVTKLEEVLVVTSFDRRPEPLEQAAASAASPPGPARPAGVPARAAGTKR
jgi:rod shape-determining protein MreC